MPAGDLGHASSCISGIRLSVTARSSLRLSDISVSRHCNYGLVAPAIEAVVEFVVAGVGKRLEER
jgi:hypothetical protein